MYFWLPNVTFLQLGIRNVIIESFFKGLAPDKLNRISDSASSFSLMLFAQFVGWTAIYIVLDKYVSSDTGARRQIMNSASDKISDIDNAADSPLSVNLLAGT